MSILKLEEDKRKKLEELYDSYLKKMENFDFPEEVIEFFKEKSYREKVVSKAMKMEIAKGHIPFLFVPSLSFFGNYNYFERSHRIENLMSMVRYKNEKGKLVDFLSSLDLRDTASTPGGGYVLYDVENGKEFLDKTPREAEKIITEKGRLGFVFQEGASLCIFTDVLKEHCVYCIETLYFRTPSPYEIDQTLPEPNKVTFFYINSSSKVPELSWHHIDTLNRQVGVASCKSRE